MKLLNYLLFIIALSSCKAQTNLENMTITYEAKTRGSSISLQATSSHLFYKNMETSNEIKPSIEFWKELTETAKKIDLSKMESFVSPSDNRSVDAALHANLSITIDQKTYTSQTFDHGNPPIELKPLVDKLFNFINVE